MLKAILGYCLLIPAAICMTLGGMALGFAEETDTPASDSVSDYSHALDLTVTGKQGVVSFRLPPAVYLNSHSADLSDLRVFDAAGEKLPFALYRPTPQKRVQKQTWPVKQFPVNAISQQVMPVDALDLEIKTNAEGALLSVKTKSPKNGKQTHEAGDKPMMACLILDLGQTNQLQKPEARPLIDALRFTLPNGTNAYSAQVWLEVSDNLKQWDMVAAAELNWLVNPETDETLTNDRLEFTPRAFRYARLSWRGGEQPLQFAEITAESIDKTAELPILDHLTILPEAGKKPGELKYSASIALPVEKIDLNFSEPNSVLTAQIGTYRELPSKQLGKPNEWVFQPLTRAVFYQINQSGQTRHSSELPIPLTHYTEWVLHPLVPTVSKPALTLLWQPATLVFLTSGPPPYTLAFGRDNVKSAIADLSQVAPGFSLQELLQTEQAQAGPLQTRQTSVANDSAADKAKISAQIRTLSLWGVLLLGVAVLGAMAWRLVKQMK